VTIDETRNDKATLQIDDARFGADPSLDFGVRADRGDPVAPNGDCLGSRMLGIDGEQVAVEKDEIGAGLGACRGADEGEKKENEARLGHRQAPVGMSDDE
jgi:hypothetical protein